MYEYDATVSSLAFDGDTIRLNIDLGFRLELKNILCRLAYIDAPELGQPGGLESRNFLRQLLPIGKKVQIKSFMDHQEPFNRWIVAIGIDDADVSETMVVNGHAIYKDYQ